MSDSIDEQVAAFADELDSLHSVDADTAAADLSALVAAIADAPDHKAAGGVILEFSARHRHSPDYARGVILGAVSGYAIHVATRVPVWAVHAMAMRIRDLVLACRVLGYGEADER